MLQTEFGNTDALLAVLDRRRPDVAAHCRRVAAYSLRLAVQLGLPSGLIETIRTGALLHDVGKIVSPGRALCNAGRPYAREWRDFRAHPEHGREICRRSGFDDDVAAIVLHHHERLDGQGYPDRLTHPAIPFTARLVSVMDAFDALTSPRSCRESLTVEAARAWIARGAGARHCPWVVSAFLAMPREMLTLGREEAADACRRPEGQVLLPPDRLASLRQPALPSCKASLS
ncbi:MAG TPA: HD domain-containing protein [Vicinamibacterales bacterium]|nr:HD domain-containing protein [Vicinamibacterales bacterium]